MCSGAFLKNGSVLRYVELWMLVIRRFILLHISGAFSWSQFLLTCSFSSFFSFFFVVVGQVDMRARIRGNKGYWEIKLPCNLHFVVVGNSWYGLCSCNANYSVVITESGEGKQSWIESSNQLSKTPWTKNKFSGYLHMIGCDICFLSFFISFSHIFLVWY